MFSRLLTKFPIIRNTNEWFSQLRKATHLSVKNRIVNQGSHYNTQSVQQLQRFSSRTNRSKNDYTFLVYAGLLSFFSSDDKDEYDLTPPKKYIIRLKRSYPFLEFEDQEPESKSPQDILITTLKQSIVAMQFEQYEKAEQMLHLALRMAQDLQDFDGITYCFDIMANLALEVEQYQKAEKLFVVVMQRLLQKGCAEDDIKMLHISAKIARIASAQKNNEKAEQGFAWSLDGIRKKVKADSNDRDLYELLGLVQDWYGKHLMGIHRYKEARSYLADAVNIYVELHGKEDPEVIDLLNNLAAVCLQVDDLEAAEKYMDEAMERAKNYPELLNTGVYQANKGLICIKKGLIAEATQQCNDALRAARKYEIREGQEHAKYCLEQIASYTSRKP